MTMCGYFPGWLMHIPVIEASGDIVVSAQPVFGYSARSGVLDVGGGWPADLARIPARGRKFQTLSQESAARIVHAVAGETEGATPASLPDFIETVVGDNIWRQEINRHLQTHAIHEQGPWRVQPVASTEDVAAFF